MSIKLHSHTQSINEYNLIVHPKVDQRAGKGRFWAQSETVKKWWKVIAECSKLNRHVQMKVAERGMNDSDEEFWVMWEVSSKMGWRMSLSHNFLVSVNWRMHRPLWLCRCFLRWSDWANRLPQISHAYGRSPVCPRMCFFRLPASVNARQQISHTNLQNIHAVRTQ